VAELDSRGTLTNLARRARDSAAIDAVRVPPHSIEAEQAVLGGLMLDNSSWDAIADRLTADDFYRRDHQLIFAAIADLAGRSEPCDAVTLSQFLERNGQGVETGGLAFLGSLANNTPSAANIRAYADIVRERSQLRGLIRVGGEIVSSVHESDGRSVSELVDEAEQRVFQIAEGSRKGAGFVALREELGPLIDELDKRHQNQGELTGVSTGFHKLDEITTGLQAGDLIVIAGRPSMGKTTLAINIAENAALGKKKVGVAIFSMEMSRSQLALRMVSSLGRVDQSKLRRGDFDQTDDWPRITGAINQMRAAPIFIDDSGALTPTEVRARARRLKREHGLGLIVIDYLQLMQVTGTAENRATEISEISRSLKALAKELAVPVIALSQLNRSVEQRNDKKPVMSDLRESGAIEQDADVIMMIYRDEVYNSDSPRKGQADVIIAKQRNGPVGEIVLTFLGRFTKFENHAPESYRDGAF